MRVSCVTFDCADPAGLAAFWAAALRYDVVGHTCRPPDGIGPYLEFVGVPEAKRAKNRVHLGFDTHDLDAEIARLTGLGATVAWEEQFPDGEPYRNVVLRDPEGNEFCLGTSLAACVRTLADAAGAAVDAADLDELRRVAASLRFLTWV